MRELSPIAVIGAGTMGRGIARAFAASGHSVRLHDRNDAVLSQSMAILRENVSRSLARGSSSEPSESDLLERISTTSELPEAVGLAPLVIEAAPEEIEVKKEIFGALSECASADAVLATNTSALSITQIAAATNRPNKVIGLHFFNPVHRMKLVEVVPGLETDEATVRTALSYCKSIGRTTVEVADRAGFVTSRINATIGNEAFYMLMEGVASAEDIDTALRLGLNHPMGPFELVDLVGLDVRLGAMRRMEASLGAKFLPCPLLVDLVEAGRLGRKVGRGVYQYRQDGSRF